MNLKDQVVLKVLGLFLFVTWAQAVMTPPDPATLPLEGNGYKVFTPSLPSVVPVLNPCDKLNCKADEICYRPKEAKPYCRPLNDGCMPNNCRLDCKYGFQKDSSGCPECACLDPCKDVECNEGFECLPDEVNGAIIGVCNKISDCLNLPCSLKCEWGQAKDSFGCSVCACYDPCHGTDCGKNQCERVYNVIKEVYEAYCPKSEDVCKSERCYKWCGIKMFIENHEDEKMCSSCNCLQPCMNLDCEKEETCYIKTKNFCQDGDICYNYQVPYCEVDLQTTSGYEKTPPISPSNLPVFTSDYPPFYPTKSSPFYTTQTSPVYTTPYKVTTGSTIDCPHGYTRDGEHCINHCYKCKDTQYCVLRGKHEFSCEECPVKQCDEFCVFGSTKDRNGCDTCQCETDACADNYCLADEFCVPTHHSSTKFYYSKTYLCLSMRQNTCTAVSAYLWRFIFIPKSQQSLDCNLNGDFKAVQLINNEIICVDTFGKLLGKGYDCYKRGIVKLTVSTEGLITQDFKKDLSKNLANYYLLSENEVVVSSLHFSVINFKSEVDVLLLSNNIISQQLLTDLTSRRHSFLTPRIVSYEVYPLVKTSSKITHTSFDVAYYYMIAGIVVLALIFTIWATRVLCICLAEKCKKRKFRNDWVSTIVVEEKTKGFPFSEDKTMNGYTEI